jgi:Zn-dependent metalloprotease
MKLNSRSRFIIRKLNNDIQVAHKIIKSKTSPFSIVGQIIDDMDENRTNKLKEENPQLNDEQILKLIRYQNEVEIKIRDLRRKMRFDRI